MDCTPVVLAHEAPFRIGGADFRPATREALREGLRTVLEPRVMQLLVALHRADGAVVTKAELNRLCWQGRIVGEDAINRVVSRLRAASEKIGTPFRVETITKVGYRLVSADSSTAIGTAGEARPRVPSLDRRALIAGGAALGTATAAGFGLSLLRRDRMPTEARVLVDDARNSLYQFTPDQIENAIGKLRRATQVAPDSAEAWGLLALAYVNSTFNAPIDQRSNRFARSESSRRRAFALEADQPDALAAQLGTSRVFRNWYSQEQQCRAALRRHPRHPVLQVALAHLLLEVGRFEESLELFESALRKTPLCVTSLSCRIVILSGLNRFEEADAALANAFALMPRQPVVWFTRMHYLTYTGRAAEAAAMGADLDGRPTGIPDWHFQLVAMQANALASGSQAEIRRTVDACGEAARRGTAFAENAAMFTAFVGRADESFRFLEALYFNRGFAMRDVYPAAEQGMYSGRERRTRTLFGQPLAAVRRAPHFARLTRELGLDDYWERTGSRSFVVA